MWSGSLSMEISCTHFSMLVSAVSWSPGFVSSWISVTAIPTITKTSLILLYCHSFNPPSGCDTVWCSRPCIMFLYCFFSPHGFPWLARRCSRGNWKKQASGKVWIHTRVLQVRTSIFHVTRHSNAHWKKMSLTRIVKNSLSVFEWVNI